MKRREVMQRIGGAASGLVLTLPRSAELLFAQQPAIIRTILKDVRPESLGAILFHEHLEQSSTFGVKGGPGAAQPAQHFTEDFDLMVDELRLAVNDGATCLVEAGHPDQGRRAPYVRQLSIHSGMSVVLSGGYHSQASYPPEISRVTEDDLVEELVRYAEAERWGAFGEIGIWGAEATPDERKMARAVSRAHLRTNLPIFTHTANGKGAVEQLEIYTKMGVDPRRIAIGHLANLNDDPKATVHKAIARQGAYIGLDRVGRDPEVDTKVIPVVSSLLDAGYVDRLLFGSDGGAFPDILKTKGGPGFARALTVFLPKLRAAGVKEETLRRITSDNPKRFLAFVPKRG